MKFILATSNKHKFDELHQFFYDSTIELTFPDKRIQIDEPYDTLLENAKVKALGHYQEFKKPTLADDSGLFVKALPSELGVKSARFGGEGHSDEERAKKLLLMLKDEICRDAYFACHLCFYISPAEIYHFEGRLQGTIAHEYSSKSGFGYDPVFIPKGQNFTLSMNAEWKKAHSHRYIAAKEAYTFFQERNCQNS